MSDSLAVMEIKAELEELQRDGSDWAAYRRRALRSRIRSQRLAEAREKGTHTREEWLAIVERFNSRCVRCGCFPVGGPCKDHIQPIYQGGSDGPDNLQPLCRECNTAKGPESFNWGAYRIEHGWADAEFQEEANA